MKRTVVLYKGIGETPLEVLRAWQKNNPPYMEGSASYAGRLDPMAEGKLLVLLGEECKKQSHYTKLDKEYEIEVLLDAGSDTGDVLGLIEYSNKKTEPDVDERSEALTQERGVHLRAYPVYSSKTVNGVPLFLHALKGTLGDIVIPEHEERIYSIKELGAEHVTTETLKARIENVLRKTPVSDEPSKELGADFRIEAVRTSWEKLFENAGSREFLILKVRVVCGSGTYMRSLAGRLGETFGTKALALSIKRTKIGKYWNGFWVKNYR